jgi:uncharacterized protein YwgA
MATPNRQDWPLVILSLADDGVLTPIEMQKALFLMKQEAGKLIKGSFYTFVPYNYGPFDQTIYNDIDALARQGFVALEKADHGRWAYYVITKSGAKRAAALQTDIDDRLTNYAKKAVAWIKSMPFPELLREIYKKYPKFAVNSVFNR